MPKYDRKQLVDQKNRNSPEFYRTLIQTLLLPVEIKRTTEGKKLIMATLGLLLGDDTVISKLYLETFQELMTELACLVKLIKVRKGCPVPLIKRGMWFVLSGDLTVCKDEPCEDLSQYESYIRAQ